MLHFLLFCCSNLVILTVYWTLYLQRSLQIKSLELGVMITSSREDLCCCYGEEQPQRWAHLPGLLSLPTSQTCSSYNSFVTPQCLQEAAFLAVLSGMTGSNYPGHQSRCHPHWGGCGSSYIFRLLPSCPMSPKVLELRALHCEFPVYNDVSFFVLFFPQLLYLVIFFT